MHTTHSVTPNVLIIPWIGFPRPFWLHRGKTLTASGLCLTCALKRFNLEHVKHWIGVSLINCKRLIELSFFLKSPGSRWMCSGYILWLDLSQSQTSENAAKLAYIIEKVSAHKGEKSRVQICDKPPGQHESSLKSSSSTMLEKDILKEFAEQVCVCEESFSTSKKHQKKTAPFHIKRKMNYTLYTQHYFL